MNEMSFSEACHADYSEIAVLQCVHLHGRLEDSVWICGHGIKKLIVLRAQYVYGHIYLWMH